MSSSAKPQLSVTTACSTTVSRSAVREMSVVIARCDELGIDHGEVDDFARGVHVAERDGEQAAGDAGAGHLDGAGVGAVGAGAGGGGAGADGGGEASPVCGSAGVQQRDGEVEADDGGDAQWGAI